MWFYLQDYFAELAENSCLEEPGKIVVCSRCDEEYEQTFVFPCGHTVCCDCMMKFYSTCSYICARYVKRELCLECPISNEYLTKHNLDVPEQYFKFSEHAEGSRLLRVDWFSKGVTVVDERIYIVLGEQSLVKVFNALDLSEMPHIQVPDLKAPESLSGCSYNKVLYISDPVNFCIHRIDLNSLNILTCIKTSDGCEPRGNSITSQHNILVTCYDRNEHVGKLVEYASDGQLIKVIFLDKKLCSIFSSAQLSEDRYALCCCPEGLTIINTEGQVVKSNTDFLFPLSFEDTLTTDDDRKFVFVTSCKDNKIYLFDSELNYLGRITISHDIFSTKPRRLYFDSSTKRLYVGEKCGNRLSILQG